MIYADKKSALVRLTDSLKVNLDSCSELASHILSIYERNKDGLEHLRELAAKALRDDAGYDDVEQAARAMIPQRDAETAAYLQVRLHGQALTAALLSRFCLESYVNSLAYYLFGETDYLGLSRSGHAGSAERILDAIERMSVRAKWQFVGGLGPSAGFSTSHRPYQDFDILFKFRDDHVHDKVRDLSDDFGTKRYGGKLPDPVFGRLDIAHATFAAETYWAMVLEVHKLIAVEPARFHRHYDLTPWRDEDGRSELRNLTEAFRVARI